MSEDPEELTILYWELYLSWLCEFLDDYPLTENYMRLLRYLFNTEFIYTLPMDENRYNDGINLRKRFCNENDISYIISEPPCNMLEMMVALALRCENQFMWDPEIGDRSPKWFWEMVANLGLLGMDDECFDYIFAEEVVTRFCKREYSYNGTGGLFVIPNPPKDMRDVEIWCQMCWYLDYILKLV